MQSDIASDYIGQGKARKVYHHAYNSQWVVKVPIASTQSNRHEWLFWEIIKNTKYAHLFCPCISYDNGYLIMQKCEPGKQNPQGIRIKGVIIKDSRKALNYGNLNGRNVLLDYSHAYNQLQGLI